MTVTQHPTSFDAFCTMFFRAEAENHGRQRRGQLAFNVLYQCHPQLANEIRTGDHDPFYDDSRMEMFWSYIAIHWND